MMHDDPIPTRTDILVVFAHPDDEIAWFGGIIPHYVAQGKTVVGLCLTRGGAQGSGAVAIRAEELRASLRTCGLDREPLWGDFEDCGWIEGTRFHDLDWVWERWGGRERARDFMLDVYARLRPSVVCTHNPETGDYGHPNHMACGQACVDAFDAAAENLGSPQKLYVSSRAADAWRIDWNRPLEAFGGRTAAEVGAAALRCHHSQGCRHAGVRDHLAFELRRSRVGEDLERREFFESLT